MNSYVLYANGQPVYLDSFAGCKYVARLLGNDPAFLTKNDDPLIELIADKLAGIPVYELVLTEVDKELNNGKEKQIGRTEYGEALYQDEHGTRYVVRKSQISGTEPSNGRAALQNQYEETVR